MVPEILYEDNHLIAVNKPAGLLTQRAAGGSVSLMDEIKDFIKRRDNKPGKVFLGMVQRLDRPVSGVIFFAKTSKAASRLAKQIRERSVTKLYTVVTDTKNRSAVIGSAWSEIHGHLLRQKGKTKVVACPQPQSKEGVLRVRKIVESEMRMFLLVQLLTGRKHQIRAQLAHLGYPVSGDSRYGGSSGFPGNGRICLHACYGEFMHPTTGNRLGISASIPDEMLHGFSPASRKVIVASISREIGQEFV